MIKCIIVGNDKSVRLASYFQNNSGGSITIPEDNIVPSLSSSQSVLSTSYIKADYLILLIDELPNFRDEIRSLAELLKEGTFFKISTIKVYGSKSDDNLKGCDQLKSIIKDINIERNKSFIVDVHLDEQADSFSYIYKDITGVVSESEQQTPMVKVYRVARGSDAKEGYEPENFSGKRIIPNVPNRAKQYRKMKEAALKSETTKPIAVEVEHELDKVDLGLTQSDIDKVIYTHNIIVVAGNPKAGTSSFSASLVRSIKEISNKDVNLIDLSENGGSIRTLGKMIPQKLVLVKNKDLLTGTDYKEHLIRMFSSIGLSSDCRLEYLKYLLQIPNRIPSDYIVIDCNVHDLRDVISCCPKQILKVILVSQAILDEVKLLDRYLKWCKEKKYNTVLYLNESIKFDRSYETISTVEIHKLYPWVHAISPLRNLLKLYDFSVLLREEDDSNVNDNE